MTDLSRLRSMPTARRELDAEEYEAFTAARDDGATWREIAAALGPASPQAAAQRYERLRRRVEQDGAE